MPRVTPRKSKFTNKSNKSKAQRPAKANKRRGPAKASGSARKGKQARSGRGMSSPMCIRELAQSVANPWMHSACIPDGSSGLGKYSLKQVNQLSTGTGTAVAIALSCSDAVNYIYADTGSTSANPVLAAASNWSTAVNTASTSVYKRNRLVSAGLRLVYAGATTADSGLILIGQVPASVSLNGFNGVTLASAMSLMTYAKVVPVRNGAKITWRPGDADDQGDLYENLGGANLTSTAVVYRPYLIALCYGLATAGAGTLYAETVTNWEGQYQTVNFSPGGISTMPSTPPEPGWYERAHKLYNQVAPIVEVFGKAAGFALSGATPSTNLLTMGSGITVEDVD